MENKSIMRATYIFAGLFLIMVCYFAYYIGVKSEEQMNNSYNKLTDKLSETTVRGSIYSSDGTVLARSVEGEDGKERREYPYGEMFCHVVGSIDYGKYGLESLYNYELLSSDTTWITKVLQDLQGEKYKGNRVITTLDVELQQAAYDAMQKYKGAVVVMEADTGKILAMLSNPAYDPNLVAENWEEISQDENSPILNRVTMGLYTPGSIFKLFTLEEYLEEGNDPGNYAFNCTGAVSVQGKDIGCANGAWHGDLDLMSSFSKSCNGSFINIGNSLKEGSLQKFCERLLFNEELPIELPYRESEFTLSGDANEFLKAQTYFGQGETLVTPMHMVLICSALANDGVLMKPMLVERIENAYGTVVEKYEPKQYKELFTGEQAAVLKQYLRSVVEDGTAARLNNFENLTVYGKTGTAQIDNGNAANSWFIGFAEKDGKSYAIAVVCEEVDSNISPAIVVARDVLKVLD